MYFLFTYRRGSLSSSQLSYSRCCCKLSFCRDAMDLFGRGFINVPNKDELLRDIWNNKLGVAFESQSIHDKCSALHFYDVDLKIEQGPDDSLLCHGNPQNQQVCPYFYCHSRTK
jgi:hypothetical protein